MQNYTTFKTNAILHASYFVSRTGTLDEIDGEKSANRWTPALSSGLTPQIRRHSNPTHAYCPTTMILAGRERPRRGASAPYYLQRGEAMGVSICYWALPPESSLFTRMQDEKPLAKLMTELFPYGNGVFNFFEDINPWDQIEILDNEIKRCPEVFCSTSEAQYWIEEYRLELDQTRLSYPGIENRNWTLERSCSLIEERLLAELLRLCVEDAETLTNKLIFGDQILYTDSYHGVTGLSLISARLVQHGSRIMSQMDIDALFPEARGADIDDASEEGLRWPLGQMRDFQRWRRLYSEAAEAGELLMVGAC
jgi:hypothetical protein